MFRKPFQTPFLKNIKPSKPSDEDKALEPQAKKRRISDNNDFIRPVTNFQLASKTSSAFALHRRPFNNVQSSVPPTKPEELEEQGLDGFYNVLWRNYTAKKHKTWDSDGVLQVSEGYAYLRDESGRDRGKVLCNSSLLPGSQLSIGGKDVEIVSELTRKEYLAGDIFVKAATPRPLSLKNQYNLSRPKSPPNLTIKLAEEQTTDSINLAAPRSIASQSSWKNPVRAGTALPNHEKPAPKPRHDPNAPQAIVMKRPSSVPKGKQIVDVVVDPLIGQHLREHQRDGVKFLYECVMGMRDFDGQGAILADEMGLGKTLQTIALLWTLLKQNPVYEAPPVIKKALIVCPVTLINNWRKEFRKWLGAERIGVYVVDGAQKRLSDFTMGKSYSVMIVGYEKLRSIQDELKKGPGIDIVVADEGHRLKTAKNKSAQAIKSLNTPRRIILSGTPIQNDLSEFFMMVDFVNPDLLGSFKSFTREFETPIIISRQPEASSQAVEKGKARNDTLNSVTRPFILRRTAELLSKYLPAKTEYVLLCRPTAAQLSVYHHVLAYPVFNAALGNNEASLQLITILKKVCNSPFLLSHKAFVDTTKTIAPTTASVISSIPSHLLCNNAASAKLRALDQLLHILWTTTSEKVVLVSHYTSTLDLLSNLLSSLSLPFLRLDGGTPSSKRQDLVDTFNRSSATNCFAFLLSAKSGGVGLNLVGASRLVLFDVDWNPATDLQAMARIHRDGQKRHCVIYRFLLAGGLDEKIWQRQITKLGLASGVMDQGETANSFTREELKDLFTLNEGLACQTHELLGCSCNGRSLPNPPATAVSSNDASQRDEDEAHLRDDDLPDIACLVQASKLNMPEQERRIKDAQRTPPRSTTNIQSLMAYAHIDTSRIAATAKDAPDLEALIHDKVLRDMLKDDENRVSFVFAKTSG